MNTRRFKLFALLMGIVGLLIVGACARWIQSQHHQNTLNRQLIAALMRDDTKTALAFVNAGADPNTREVPTPAPSFTTLLNHLLHRSPVPVNNSPTALMFACGIRWGSIRTGMVEEDVPLLRAMLAHGANVNAEDFFKHGALYDAVAEARVHTVELLLQHGANVNAQDEDGTTPLIMTNNVHLMSMSEGRDIARLLLAHGADPNLRAYNGRTALQVAQHNGRGDLELIALLKQAAAKK
ncbi:MAG: bcorl1 [Chthonomonadaceae bacterium]|nr:bcorl1 [Chthonomonadaceae bacterium]